MPRSHPLAVVVLFALALVSAGCGGSDSETESSKASPAKLIQQDAEAKSNARELVTAVEACFVDEQSYEGCVEPTTTTELPLGSGSGQVEVSEATPTGYTIAAHSVSGTVFEVAKEAGGALTRTCDAAGSGGCREGGSW